MNALHCPSEERLLRYVDGDLAARDRDALSAHLVECALCRKQAETLNAAIAELRRPALPDFDAAAHARAVLERLPEADSGERSSAKRRRWRARGVALACAAALVLAARSTSSPGGTWQARGATRSPSIARDVGVQLYEVDETVRALTPNASIAANAALSAGYRNLGNQPAHLLLFAVDQAGAIHWIAPPYLEASSDPSAVEIPPNREEQLLPHSVQLQDLSPGPLRVMTVITRSRAHVSHIEALESSGVSAQRITGALPDAEVRELRLQVDEVRP